MPKGDDALARKKNKVRRKRMRGKETVTARVASIIASKNRRKAGKRRMCEGMCFSLPTPEDPFNDRNDPKAKKAKKASPLDGEKKAEETQKKENIKLISKSVSTSAMQKNGEIDTEDGCLDERPSKFLFVCLKTIESALSNEDISGHRKCEPLLASAWGFELWKECSSGSDILDTSGSSASTEQVAWIVSAATDIISRNEQGGLIINGPFLIYLVPSKERAVEVRSVCKPLKELGIHTVSLHPEATLDYQMQGLKMSEPEFVVATPERLLELVLLKAIDISDVSLLVIDGLDNLSFSGFLEKIKSIKELISKPRTIVFSESFENTNGGIVQFLVRQPARRLSLSKQ